ISEDFKEEINMENKYYTTIGLEIHAELKTKTKMFCSCKNDPDEEKPNVNICPVCMAHPGALPVINKKAIEYVIKVGLALDSSIADFSEFDRKNYFYPDIPKGYQISQYKYPIVSGGHLADFDITRVHLEEDTANNKHDRGDYSLIDFNRAGVPLMELVTEAHTFDSAERAILFEVNRMTQLHDSGKETEIVQETRGWDENKQKTFSQRKKESSEGYRYFPEPDLPKLKLHEAFDLEKMKKDLPELPIAKRARYKNDFEIKDEDIQVYVNDVDLGRWFEEVAKNLMKKDSVKILSNYVTSDYLGFKKNNPEIKLPSSKNFVELINLVAENKISSRVAKDVLAMIVFNDESQLKIATEKNLLQSNDESALKGIVEKIIKENPEVVATYKGGKENAMMSLVGKIIKESNGSANPQIVIKLLKEMLT